jgi:hypothetical protein
MLLPEPWRASFNPCPNDLPFNQNFVIFICMDQGHPGKGLQYLPLQGSILFMSFSLGFSFIAFGATYSTNSHSRRFKSGIGVVVDDRFSLVW